MKKLVFLCSGNTCRSPLALAAWRALQEKGKAPLEIDADSAGLMAADGAPSARHSQAIAREWKQDLSAHRSKPLSLEAAKSADWLVAMSASHALTLQEYFGLDASRVLLLGSFDSQNGDDEIPDPFGGSREAYETCAARIRRAVEKLAQAIEQQTIS